MTRALTIFYCLAKNSLVVLTAFVLIGCTPSEEAFQGYIEGDYAYIASAISGNLTQRLVNRGDEVIGNQPLFVLDPEPETAKLNQAKFQLARANQQLFDLQKGARTTVIANIEAQLKQAQASLFFTKKTFERYDALYQAAAIGKADFDKAKSEYDQNLQKVKEVSANLAEAKLGARKNLIKAQKAAVDAAKASVRQAKWALLQKSVRSPAKAQVFDTLYEPGEFVSAGQPVVVLLPPENIKVVFFVPEKVVSTINVGKDIIIDCDSCKNSYKAKINFISPNAEYTPPVIFSQESRDKLVYRVEAKPSLSVAEKFHPGQPVDVIFE